MCKLIKHLHTTTYALICVHVNIFYTNRWAMVKAVRASPTYDFKMLFSFLQKKKKNLLYLHFLSHDSLVFADTASLSKFFTQLCVRMCVVLDYRLFCYFSILSMAILCFAGINLFCRHGKSRWVTNNDFLCCCFCC